MGGSVACERLNSKRRPQKFVVKQALNDEPTAEMA